MTKFYTLDRSGTLSENQIVNLVNISTDSLLVEIKNLLNRESIVSRGNELFPEGISRHGEQYLLLKKLIVNNPNGLPSDLTPTNPMIEIIFELVRKSMFPHLPSRMQSIFCWQTLDDLKKFTNDLGFPDNRRLNVFEVETDNFFIGDMKLLYLGGQGIHAMSLACMYWSGERTLNPHLEVLVPLPVQVGSRVEI